MTGKIAILRGINVGGHRIIRMQDLKNLFVNSGFQNVRTYIQSGNVLFDTKLVSDSEISAKIEKAIFKNFGFEVPVFVRSVKELEQCILENPFKNNDINKLYITFLQEEPIKENIRKTESFQFDPDKFVVSGKQVFIYCEGKFHQTKLNNNFFEKSLEARATTRNWKTILKLVELSKNENRKGT